MVKTVGNEWFNMQNLKYYIKQHVKAINKGQQREEEEEEEEEEEISPETKAEKLVKEAEEAQEEPTVQLKDDEVDALAKKLAQTGI